MRIIIVALLLLTAAPAWANTYYVSPSGSNTSPYDTWAKAANLPSSAVTAGAGAVGPHTMYVAPGSYTDAIVLSSANWGNSTIIGTTAHGSTTEASWSQIVSGRGARITSSGANHTYYANYNGAVTFTLRGVEIIGTDSTKHGLNLRYGTSNVSNVYAHGAFASTVNVFAGATATVSASKLTKGGSTYEAVVLTGGTTNLLYTIVSNELTGDATALGSTAMIYTFSGALNVYNCLVSGSRSNFIRSASSVTNVRNSIVGPFKAFDSNLWPLYKDSGTFNATNNLILAHVVNNAIANTTLDTNTGNITQVPKFKSRAKRGIISLDIDDAGGESYVQSIIPSLKQRNVKATYFFEGAGFASYSTAIKQVEATAGRPVYLGSHTWSHYDLTYAHGLNVTGGASCQIAFDSTTKVFTGSGCTTGANNFTYDATGKTLGQIIAAITGNGKGWTANYSTTGGQLASHFSASTSVNNLATKTATAVPTDIDFDRSGTSQGVFKEEFVNMRDFLISHFPNNPGNRTAAAPYNSSDATILTNAAAVYDAYRVGENGSNYDLSSIAPVGLGCLEVFTLITHGRNAPATAVADNGSGAIRVTYTGHAFLNGEQVVVEGVTGSGAADINGTWTVANVATNTFDLVGTTYNAGHVYTLTNSVMHVTDAALVAKVRVLCEMIAEFGIWANFLAHNQYELTVAQWDLMLATMQEYADSILILPTADAYNYVTTSGLWSGTGTYTRTWVDGSDYRLKGGSPAINAGIDVGLTTDFNGKPLRGVPDIGAYEYYPAAGGGGFTGFGFGFQF